MKKLLKNKVMIGFAVFVIGILFVTSCNEKNVQKNDLQSTNQTSHLKMCNHIKITS